jgi:hypothetical protein
VVIEALTVGTDGQELHQCPADGALDEAKAAVHARTRLTHIAPTFGPRMDQL